MKLNRLTKVVNEGMYGEPIYVGSYGNIVDLGNNQATSLVHDKLGQLEDIEDELGIDLLTLLRVQTAGAYFKGKDRKWIPTTDYDEKCFKLMETEIYRFYFKDYGKTWALKEDELE